jgi:phosphoadenosine phosphosulfate reductase
MSLEASKTTAAEPKHDLRPEVLEADASLRHSLNARLHAMTAPQRVAWALEHLPGKHVLSSSFGAQAAVSLHLVTQLMPDVPVIVIDTGYLFPETYRFIDELTQRLRLNLQVYTSERSPAWLEARHGKLWSQGRSGLDQYLELQKLGPMQRALRSLGARTWIAGLRRAQSSSRSVIDALGVRDGRFKLHPIFDWTDRDVHRYLQAHDLPYHPLWDKGYVSIGDWHSTRSLDEVSAEDELRFGGLKRECGLHGLDG